MTKKPAKKIAAADADQYMLRLPPGLRDRVARRAAENGRSMNTEIIDAVEKHLRDADRITQLWEMFEKNPLDLIWAAVEDLERAVSKLNGDPPGRLTQRRHDRERFYEQADQAIEQMRLKADVGALRRELRAFTTPPEKEKDPPA
jgi:hypothetical protein